MSLIENEMYEDFKTEGEVKLDDFVFVSSDLPQAVLINNTIMNFTPQYLQLKSFECTIGQSDFNLSGKIENYLAYVFKDETIRGDFNFYSSNINANEFLTEEEETTPQINESEVKQDSVSQAMTDTSETVMTVFEVPGNINFILRSEIDHILYDKLDIDNLKGTILIKDSKVNLDGLVMNLLDGYVGVDGEYNTQDMDKPKINMGLDIRDMEIQNAVNSFSMLDSLAPILKNCKCKISLKFNYFGLLDSTMYPVLNSIDGYGRLQSDNIQIINVKTFDKIANLIKLNGKFNNSFEDINISFYIKDGRIIVEPFEIKSDGIKMKIGGAHGLDQTMDYNIALTIPREKFGSAANAVVDNMIAEAAKKGIKINPGENVNLKVRIYGDINDPKIGLTKDDSDNAAEKLKEQIKEELKKKGKEEIAKQAQALINDAQNGEKSR
jgi:subtilisin-like proprotein convertase family protein